MSAAQKELHCTSVRSSPVIGLRSGEDLVRLETMVPQPHPRLFITPSALEGFPEGAFGLCTEGVVYVVSAGGFDTFADLLKAEKIGLTNKTDWTLFQSSGLADAKEYLSFKHSGFQDLDMWRKATAQGFIGSFTDLLSKTTHSENFKKKTITLSKTKVSEVGLYVPQFHLHQGRTIGHPIPFAGPIPHQIKHEESMNEEAVCFLKFAVKADLEVYRANLEMGDFPTYSEFVNAIELGISSVAEYEAYRDSGFNTYSDYLTGKSRGLLTFDEAKRAASLGLVDGKSLAVYLEDKGESEKAGYQEIELWLLARHVTSSYIERNREFSMDTLIVEWKRIVGDRWKSTYQSTIPHPLSGKDAKELEATIRSLPLIHEYFYFDEEKRVYRKKQIRNLDMQRVVLDGANVAWAGKSREAGDRPELRHIVHLRETLEAKGFSTIEVICDATLGHEIDNPNEYRELKQNNQLIEVPAGTTADEFLLERIKKIPSLIISNDQFREWKERDLWINENLDTLRVGFIVVDGEISLSVKIQSFLR